MSTFFPAHSPFDEQGAEFEDVRQAAALAASGQVPAYFATLRDACQTKRHGLSVDDEHPLVAMNDVGQELLHHDTGGAALIQGFDDAA